MSALPPYRPNSLQFSPPKSSSRKGKERAVDGPALVSYRHLLNVGGNSGAANPLRTIAHIDIDAAYAAMEMARLGVDAAIPLAVQQWNGLIAVNYAARAFGITRHESPAEARKKCPELVLVHVATLGPGDLEPTYHQGDVVKPETHKVRSVAMGDADGQASLDTYRRESLRIIKVFQEFCPVVEKASIDESYLDLTARVKAIILERYPLLARVPAGETVDSPLPSPEEMGVEIDWRLVGNVIPNKMVPSEPAELLMVDGGVILMDDDEEQRGSKDAGSGSDLIKKVSVLPGSDDSVQAEAEEHDDEELALSWSDVALSIGAEIVNECRGAVEQRLGYTCSAGIASNKMLAKLGSGWKKPNAQTILRPVCVASFLAPMRFQKIRNFGGKFGATVKAVFEAELVGDLLQHSIGELQTKLGEDSGKFVWEILRGIDYTEVEAKTQVKSMLSSKNFRPSINTYAECWHWLNILATELHLRLKEARDESPGLWPKTITFSHRSVTYVSKSHQVPFAYTSSLSVSYILKHAKKLLQTAIASLAEKGTAPSLAEIESGRSKIGPFSNLQLSFSVIEKLEAGQKGIERFFTGSAAVKGATKRERDVVSQDGRSKKAKAAVRDEVKLLEKVAATERGIGLPQQQPGMPTWARYIELDDKKADSIPNSVPPDDSLPSYRCPRCPHTSPVTPAARASLLAEQPTLDTVDISSLLIERLRIEHADWHYARDLDKQDRSWGRQHEVPGGPEPAPSLGREGKRAKGAAKGGRSGQPTLQSFFR